MIVRMLPKFWCNNWKYKNGVMVQLKTRYKSKMICEGINNELEGKELWFDTRLFKVQYG